MSIGTQDCRAALRLRFFSTEIDVLLSFRRDDLALALLISARRWL
jgi:hypothetical protein